MEKDEFLDNIKELPKWVELYGINHHSPSQINSNDDIWSYKYLYLSQEERRELPINSKMFSGVCLGDMAQLQFGNYVWEYVKGKGLTRKEIPPQRKVFEKIIEKFNLYDPADDKDREQHDINRQGLALTFQQLKYGLREIKLKTPIDCERSVSLNLPNCLLPCIGRIDIEDENKFVEIKTKWRKKNRPRKDGTSNYSIPKIDEGYLGWQDHILQVAFYWLACNKKKKPHLLVINEKDYNVFTPDNCDDLKPENLELQLNKMAIVAKRRERVMENHAGKTTWFQDIPCDFDHFFWNGLGDHKQAAMKLWGLL